MKGSAFRTCFRLLSVLTVAISKISATPLSLVFQHLLTVTASFKPYGCWKLYNQRKMKQVTLKIDTISKYRNQWRKSCCLRVHYGMAGCYATAAREIGFKRQNAKRD